MPIEFIQQSQPAGSSSDTLFRLLMKYDGTGRRISKTVMHKVAGAADWDTAQVTIGTEIRENFVGPAKETKVVVNMPEGLGRYEPEDAAVLPSSSTSRTFEWYLKNHLGSTMLVYASAYGTPIELVSTNGADMRRWQGKEFDGQHGKYYFGARYFDPFFGLWMSPDPASQFLNPYTYGGDPVNYVDPNGEMAWLGAAIGAAIGATIGSVSALYQCTQYDGGSCPTGIAKGAFVGGAAGAAGGAVAGPVGAVGGPIAAGIAAGAAGSAAGYTANYMMTGEGSFGEGFRQMMVGSAVGLVGGIGTAIGGASGAILGGFAGGSLEPLVNGQDAENVVQAGLIGAAMGLTNFTIAWINANRRGPRVTFVSDDLDDDHAVIPENPEGDFVADEYKKEAYEILRKAADEYAKDHHLRPGQVEAAASFKVKTTFWTGKEYLDHSPIQFGETEVANSSGLYDDFRMHLHPDDSYQHPSHHPSKADYGNARGFDDRGIGSYIGTRGRNGNVELYYYKYRGKEPRFWRATW